MYSLLFISSSAIALGLIYLHFKTINQKDPATIIVTAFAVMVSIAAGSATFVDSENQIPQRITDAAIYIPRIGPHVDSALPPVSTYNWKKPDNRKVTLVDPIVKLDRTKQFLNFVAIIKNDMDLAVNDIEVEINPKTCHIQKSGNRSCVSTNNQLLRKLYSVNIGPHGLSKLDVDFKLKIPDQNYVIDYKIANITYTEHSGAMVDTMPTCGHPCGNLDMVPH